jgi:hypothetical protein
LEQQIRKDTDINKRQVALVANWGSFIGALAYSPDRLLREDRVRIKYTIAIWLSRLARYRKQK